MRQLTIPEELALPHLLELGQVDSLLFRYFDKGYERIYEGNYEEAIKKADQIVTVAGSDRSTASCGKLLLAEALRRMGRLLESIEVVKDSRRWLELQNGFRSRYNDAIAFYFEGCLRYMLRDETGVIAAFTYVQQELAKIQDLWWIDRIYHRKFDCQRVQDWIEKLLDLELELSHGTTFVVPVYELLLQRISLTRAKEIYPFQVSIPAELVAKHLSEGPEYPSDEYVPIMNQTISFMSLEPDVNYVAIRSSEDGDIVPQVKKGELCIFEAITSVAEKQKYDGPITNRSFVRLEDGKIAFRPIPNNKDEDDENEDFFLGILRLIIREDSES